MKIVGRYSTADEAHLAKMKLGAAGIDSYLFDEYTIQIYWLYSDAMGGVRLQVADADLKDALDVLTEAPTGEGIKLPPCPKCNSENTELDPLPGQLACFFMIFIAPLICIGRQFRCKECKAAWNAEQEQQKEDIKPGPASQYTGWQFIIPGAVLLFICIASILVSIFPDFDVVFPQNPHSDQFGFTNSLRESFDYTYLKVDSPIICLLVGICLFVTGLMLYRYSKGEKC